MNKNAIGVFDSGLGGLTAVKELLGLLPNEDIVYFGDTSRVPYGTRSFKTITDYAAQDLNFLATHNVKIALVACGTVSAVALPALKNNYPFSVVGVIESAVNAATYATKNKKIAILGTAATIKSNAYGDAIKSIDQTIETLSIACPLFVPLVENGHTSKNDELTRGAVKLYLSAVKDFGADTVILGCTHYPLIAGAIGEFLGEKVTLISSGKEAAKTIKSLLERENMLNTDGGSHRFFVSDSTESFENYAGLFLGKTLNGEVKKVNIENY